MGTEHGERAVPSNVDLAAAGRRGRHRRTQAGRHRRPGSSVGVAIAWSLFQLWYASPLPFMLGFGVFSDTEARAFHLSFALFLAFTGLPGFRVLAARPRSALRLGCWPRSRSPAVLYLVVFYQRHRAASGPADARRHLVVASSASCCCSKPRGAPKARGCR